MNPIAFAARLPSGPENKESGNGSKGHLKM